MKIQKKLALVAAAAGATFTVLCVVSMLSGAPAPPAGGRILVDKFAGFPSSAEERTAVFRDDRGRRFTKRIVAAPGRHAR